jgi:MFS family permease
MFLVVLGILLADDDAGLMVAFLVAGAVLLAAFAVHILRTERRGGTPLLSTAVFRNRVANLGLVTQNAQWLILMGTSFTVATYLQVARGYNAIETGVIFTAATVGILVSSLAAERLAKRHTQRTLILTGFVVTVAGVGLLIGLVVSTDRIVAFVPGLLLIGLGLGVMLTPSVNVVQSSFPETRQGEISGLSRSISNLGSSFGTAIAGTILLSGLADGNGSYALAMAVLAGVGLIGLVAAALMPRRRRDPLGAGARLAAAR